ncbi:dihydropteroate synthase [Robiginitalea biformata]|uniref:Dihydropteroate synthase n=1 Tax=Robiginitalea biformata (strain ATCC BAA-864 / DSM 15991 / KCTC 12146 / HTCC2501) TaxID=313596 RepID=A4CM77_ROBBH|nr:dihydropteroate synthase [Robiginitalea biformata]EAR14769.1 putative dihydropteroate synthase [Robiginitalea biformata HTCC2501]
MTICCNGKLLDLSTPRIMGILNSTPDSFYDGGRFADPRAAMLRAEQLLGEGADFLDVGGYSTRPGAGQVSESEELGRVVPLVEKLAREFPEARISVDTFRSRVARETLGAGAALINDITAGEADPKMLPLLAEKQVPVILMHMRGTPATMSGLTDYDHLVTEVLEYLSGRLLAARELGIVDVLADPGFGFAKTREQNFELLGKLRHFGVLDVPILVGLSRKSMIWKTLGITPDEALNGTTALHMAALFGGASILRVHDAAAARECIHLWQAIGSPQ